MPYKDPIIRKQKQYGYSKKYWSRFPEKDKARKAVWHANKKAKSLGLNGRLQSNDLEALFRTTRYCDLCKLTKPLGELSIDHIIPFKKSGDNIIGNIQIICWQCNMEKTYKDKKDSWSTRGENCLGCGTNERRHEAKGYCMRCYDRLRAGWLVAELSTPKRTNRWW